MSYGQPKWAAAKTAKKRNLVFTIPSVLFLLLGLGFLAVFLINYVEGLIDGGHYLALIISGSAAAFLTLSVFTLLLSAAFKLCGYLAGLFHIKLNEQLTPPLGSTRERLSHPPVDDEPKESSPADS